MVLPRQGPRTRSTTSMAFPFLKLPPEIRCCIYKLVLEAPKPIQAHRTARPIFDGTTTRSRKRLRPRMTAEQEKRACGTSTLALLATCRLIYLEAVDFYYARNAFECCTTAHLPDFLDSIGTTNLNLISEIRYHAQAGDDMATLEHTPGLRTLKIVSGSQCPDCTHDQVFIRPSDWFKDALEELWGFCARRPGLEMIGLLRLSSWAGTGAYPRLRVFEGEIGAMSEYLK